MIGLEKDSLDFETKEAVRSEAKEIQPEAATAQPTLAGRLISLDVFRGLTIAGMVLVVVFGVNALALYVLSGLMAKALLVIPKLDGSAGDLKTFLYERVFATWLSPINASLAFALSYLALWWLLMLVLYRRKIFIKV